MAFGLVAGLEIVDNLETEPPLKTQHRPPSVRGDRLFKLGRFTEARAEPERAAPPTENEQERALSTNDGRSDLPRPLDLAQRVRSARFPVVRLQTLKPDGAPSCVVRMFADWGTTHGWRVGEDACKVPAGVLRFHA